MDKKKTIKAYLFDFDGVMINSEPKRFNILKKCLGKFNLRFEKFITYHHLIGTPVVNILSEHFPHIDSKKTINSILREYNFLVDEYFENTPSLFPNLKKTLGTISQPKAIVTNAKKERVLKVLKYHNINQYFSFIISCKNKVKPKPSPDGYKKACEKLNLKPSDVAVIEDSDAGIKSARAAGVKKIFRYTYKNKNFSNSFIYNEIKLGDYKNLLSFNKSVARENHGLA